MKLAQKVIEMHEAEMSLKSNPKLHKAAMEKAKELAKFGDDFKLTLVKAMNPKKLSVSDIETLKDILDS